jgi:tetratricopeptide (TPR) repeat protein
MRPVTTTPNQALKRTRRGCSGHKRMLLRAGSLSFIARPTTARFTMPPAMSQPDSNTECEARSRRLDRQMRFLWIAGRRKKLAAESFGLGQACRQNGNAALAETNFRRVQFLFEDKHPSKSKDSLEDFAVLAASCNHLGLLHLHAGQPEEARPSFDQAIEIRRELNRLSPDDRENQVYLGGALCNRAHSVADSDTAAAIDFYQQSLAVLRHPARTCECSYWDEQRQSWWCMQLEALGDSIGLQWVFLAPQFIDNATQGLSSLEPPAAPQLSS